MKYIIAFLLVSTAFAESKYVSGYVDQRGVVIGYGCTDSADPQPVPDGMTFFAVPVSKFKAAGDSFKLNGDTIEARSKAEIEADTSAAVKKRLRRQLYEERRLLDAIDAELAVSPENSDMKSDREAQQAVVDALRKQVNP